MKKILVVAMLCLSALSVQAQEKVMNILKTDGTSSQTRVAEVKQIDFLNLTENNEAEQTATMIMKIINGAVFRTKVNVVNEITFADTTYNFNSSGYRILEANDLSWPEDRLLPVFSQPAVTLRSLDMSAANLSDEERVMFCTL